MRMTQLDRRWGTARTLGDLGHVAADWLEGHVPGGHPNGSDSLDDETAPLVPLLARLNRAGFCTDTSQPGCAGPGIDGAWWEQRAGVDGWIAFGPLFDRIRHHARRAGITVVAYRPGSRPRAGIPATTRDHEPCMWYGVWEPHRIHAHWVWGGVGGGAMRQLRTATRLTLIDPKWGPSDRLWDALDKAVQ